MSTNQTGSEEKIVSLLQYLLVIELWRGGLSQAEIRTRLGIGITTINKMLKGVDRSVQNVAK